MVRLRRRAPGQLGLLELEAFFRGVAADGGLGLRPGDRLLQDAPPPGRVPGSFPLAFFPESQLVIRGWVICRLS